MHDKKNQQEHCDQVHITVMLFPLYVILKCLYKRKYIFLKII